VDAERKAVEAQRKQLQTEEAERKKAEADKFVDAAIEKVKEQKRGRSETRRERPGKKAPVLPIRRSDSAASTETIAYPVNPSGRSRSRARAPTPAVELPVKKPNKPIKIKIVPNREDNVLPAPTQAQRARALVKLLQTTTPTPKRPASKAAPGVKRPKRVRIAITA